MKKILLTGVTGQVGRELQKTLVPLGEIVSVTRQDIDLTKPELIRSAIAELKPDIIINAAAYTAVDKAETEPKLATAINGVAPTIFAESAQKLGATLVHISTDYVFNGQNYTPYTEEDRPNPLGVYGKSKLMGEEGVRNNCDRHLILRTAWVYGSRGHGNFVKTMLRLGAEREQLRIVADQIGSPTWSYDIATTITQLVSKSVTGTYNFSSSGVASWYDFAVAIFSEAKQLDFPLKIKQIIPITTAEYPTPAQRPAYSVLSKVKITQTLGNYPPHWQKSLKQMLSEWRSIIS
ncbi:MAG: dTDP-4-dehydrorhamnose reductase [Xenococcaceae cyanobacterium MO_188.B32]|nr:dTDP-4-dehydrorhamnose reductase [Xenococcaceae cyanobacterium MO_188.B32]